MNSNGSENDGRILCPNGLGAESPQLHPFQIRTIREIEQLKPNNILEVGPGFGRFTSEVFKLAPFFDSYSIVEKSPALSKHLQLKLKSYNKIQIENGDIREYKLEKNFDFIIMFRVIHYLRPNEIITTINRLKGLLSEAGRIYLLCVTPFMKAYLRFYKTYAANKKIGLKFPGFCEYPIDYIDHTLVSERVLDQNRNHSMTFFDIDTAYNIAKLCDLNLIHNSYSKLCYYSESWSLDGKENIEIVFGV